MASKFRRILFGAGFPVAMPTTPSKSWAEVSRDEALAWALNRLTYSDTETALILDDYLTDLDLLEARVAS
jgi:hypothetical protein